MYIKHVITLDPLDHERVDGFGSLMVRAMSRRTEFNVGSALFVYKYVYIYICICIIVQAFHGAGHVQQH
jgi:hypothetical protein